MAPGQQLLQRWGHQSLHMLMHLSTSAGQLWDTKCLVLPVMSLPVQWVVLHMILCWIMCSLQTLP